MRRVGRPPLGEERRQLIAIRLDPTVLRWLKISRGQSLIDDLLAGEMKKASYSPSGWSLDYDLALISPVPPISTVPFAIPSRTSWSDTWARLVSTSNIYWKTYGMPIPIVLGKRYLAEIIANSLDSGAGRIALTADPDAVHADHQSTTDLASDGKRCGSITTSLPARKVHGQGIGFAGVGIKLGLLVCEEVLTETRRGSTHVATRDGTWPRAIARRGNGCHRLECPASRGTAVRLKL